MSKIHIKKRDNTIVDFNEEKIISVINKAASETYENVDLEFAKRIAEQIRNEISLTMENSNNIKTVEDIQDLVEKYLTTNNRQDIVKKYTTYRNNRNNSRNNSTKSKYKLLSDEFLSKYKHLPNPMNNLGQFVFYRTYSRLIPKEKRREYWWETVNRVVEFSLSLGDVIQKESLEKVKKEAEELYDNIYNLRQFPAGRTLWVGGTRSATENAQSNFNCAGCVMDDLIKFKEMFILLMLGAGVTVRILKSDVEKLPKIRNNLKLIHNDFIPVKKYAREEFTSIVFQDKSVTIVVGDSRDGWAVALEWYFKILTDKTYKNIHSIYMNYDNVRLKGEKLVTFGGRASGYESLKNMFIKIHNIISNISEGKLKPIHCLDIADIIGENVVSGAVRRTALMLLISPDDIECLNAKSDLYILNEKKQWVENTKISHRKMSNNTIYYEYAPCKDELNSHMEKIRYSGEPGFLNVMAAKKRKKQFEIINPCGEALLTDREMCNLVTTNAVSFVENGILNMSKFTHAIKLGVRMAMRLCTVEFELHTWNQVLKENPLVGVSLTGWQDMINLTNLDKKEQNIIKENLKKAAIEESIAYAAILRIKEPELVTLLKPEGTLSLVAGVSSGFRYSDSEYYIRRIRISTDDPVLKVCMKLDYPMFPEVGEDLKNCKTMVVEFPVKAPSGKMKENITAIEQLEEYVSFMEHYIQHNASCTIHVKDDEWDGVGEWLFENWDKVVGVSFLPYDNSFYSLMPYESITKDEYEKRVSKMKPFIPSLISKYENEENEEEDWTVGISECVGNICPLR